MPDLNYPPGEWRLLWDPPAPGAWNMAVDEALLESIAGDHSAPILRLYSWEPACLSLGYAQSSADVDLPRLAASGWDLVRRPTGGRAILHTDELTYAVIAPAEEPRLAGGILESYRRLSAALLEALLRLQAPATANPTAQSNSQAEGPVCFEVPSHYEITVLGKKLIGSAQVRRRSGVLQHGSLPLHGDLTRITQVLAYPAETYRVTASQRLLQRATTLEAALGSPVSWDAAAQAFVTAFEHSLNLSLNPSRLTPLELQRSQELEHTKYRSTGWTERL